MGEPAMKLDENESHRDLWAWPGDTADRWGYPISSAMRPLAGLIATR